MPSREEYTSRILRQNFSLSPEIINSDGTDDDEPLSSRTRHLETIRSQFDEEKCRSVLVKKLSCYPRNMDYREGIQCIFGDLSTWFSDENLPLSIGVLYELLEIPSDHTSDFGSCYQRWRHEHKLRKDDFTGKYTPARGNMIIGEIVPTQRLIDYRTIQTNKLGNEATKDDPESTDGLGKCQTSSPITSRSKCAVTGLRPHMIEYNQFESTTVQGTVVRKRLSPQEIHNLAWDTEYSSGGRLIQQRTIDIEELQRTFCITEPKLEDPIPAPGGDKSPKKTDKALRSTAKLGGRFLKSIHAKTSQALHNPVPRNPAEARYQRKVAKRPEPGTKEGKLFYSAIENVPLVGKAAQYNAVFARKHGIILGDGTIDKDMLRVRKPTAEELAKELDIRGAVDEKKHPFFRKSFGPLTPNLLIEDEGNRMSSYSRRFIGGQWDGAADSPESIRRRCLSSSPTLDAADVSATGVYCIPSGQISKGMSPSLLRRNHGPFLSMWGLKSHSAVSLAGVLDHESPELVPANFEDIAGDNGIKQKMSFPGHPLNNQNSTITSHDSSYYNQTENKNPSETKLAMDTHCDDPSLLDKRHIEPLRIRKQSAQVLQSPPRVSQRFPPRSSSIPTSQRQSSSTTNSRTQNSSQLSSSQRTSYASSGIMGNFRQLESPDSGSETLSLDQERARREERSRQVAAFYRELTKENPFEFNYGDDKDVTRMTRIGDFIAAGKMETTSPHSLSEAHYETSPFDESGSCKARSPAPLSFSVYKRKHVKNSRSEGTALYTADRPEGICSNAVNPAGFGLPRCESSPSHEAMSFGRTFPHVLRRSESSPLQSPRHQFESTERFEARDKARSHSQGNIEYDYQGSPERSYNNAVTGCYDRVHRPSRSPSRGRGLSRSLVKQLDDVQERDEMMGQRIQDLKPRARSPMKKLFGEGGWLGSIADLEAGPSYRSKKPSMLGLIKNKIGEIAERADLSPIKRSFKSDSHRAMKPTTFPISLNPSEQAGISTDLELIICATANRYLMDQYKEGRLSVESVRKILDFWKSKARAQVIEFQYDQATQRDLIALNVKTFRFFGERAGNILHINTVLWTWRENAREMSVRTFCAADSVIQKQLNDTYKLLELLGAHTVTFLALQELHSHFNRSVHKVQNERLAKKATETAATPIGVEHHWSPPTTFDKTRTRSKGSDPGPYDGSRQR